MKDGQVDYEIPILALVFLLALRALLMLVFLVYDGVRWVYRLGRRG